MASKFRETLSDTSDRVTNFIRSHQSEVRLLGKMVRVAGVVIGRPKFSTMVTGLGELVFNWAEAVTIDGDVDDFFTDKGWVDITPFSAAGFYLRAFTGIKFKEVGIRYGLARGVTAKLDGIEVGLSFSSRDTLDTIWTPPEHKAQVLASVRTRLQSMLPAFSVFSTKAFDDYGRYKFEIKPDEFDARPNKAADPFIAKIKAFNNVGLSRSILFAGPPGTGKTTLAKSVIAGLGYRVLRISQPHGYKIADQEIREAINAFQPQAVMFDDFDRFVFDPSFLELLEWLHVHTKFVAITANKPVDLDHATKRPDRIDQVVEVLTLPTDIVEELLGADKSFLPRVKHWPVAYIQELNRRRMVSKDPKETEESIKELEKRQKEANEWTKRREPKEKKK